MHINPNITNYIEIWSVCPNIYSIKQECFGFKKKYNEEWLKITTNKKCTVSRPMNVLITITLIICKYENKIPLNIDQDCWGYNNKL